MTYTYIPRGVCSRQMTVEIENDTIKHVDIVGGCNGNLKGIASLLQGMRVEDAIARMEGITCGPRPTSCPDQLPLHCVRLWTLNITIDPYSINSDSFARQFRTAGLFHTFFAPA